MFCAAASYWDEGDSGYFINGGPAPIGENAYLKDADPKDPLVFPINSPTVLAKFPPSLLVVATRDFALSSVVHTHSELIRLGVEADLHVWEGLGHAFFFDPELPQSREMYDVTVKFFDRHLGK
jgi:epsilon-lactone hydrolase